MSELSPQLFGVAAEFPDSAQILHAASEARRHKFDHIHAFVPVPVAGLAEMSGAGGRHLVVVGIAAASLGLIGFFGFCLWATMLQYPFIIGGRPLFSWAYYVIPSVSISMLVGAVATTLFMLFLNRLPRLNHPAFNIEGFERATRDRFFLTIEATGKDFDADAALRFLRGLSPAPLSIQIVPR